MRDFESPMQNWNQELTDLVPALKFEERASISSSLNINTDCQDELDHLIEQICQREPDAGRAYYATQVIRQLLWQPVYLMLAAVYCKGLVPSLMNIEQQYENGHVWGIGLHEGFWQNVSGVGSPGILVEQGSREISSYFDAVYLLLLDRYHLSEKMAKKQVIDLVAKGVIAILSNRMAVQVAAEHRLWIQALGFGVENKIEITANGFRIEKATCCMHYKTKEREYCAQCPLKKRK